MLRKVLIFIPFLLIAGLSSAEAERADEDEADRHYRRGTVQAGLTMGYAGGAGSTFILGGSLGYFVLDGLEPGAGVLVQAARDEPTLTLTEGFARYFLLHRGKFSPFISARAGRLFRSGASDGWLLGAGGGLNLFANPRLAMEIRFSRDFYFMSGEPRQETNNIGLGFAVYF